MQNKTDVINMALRRCGAAGVNAAFQDSQSSEIANAAWKHCYNLALSTFVWSFAQKQVLLARAPAAPVLGYKYAYPLPGDCVTVMDCHGYSVDEDGVARTGHVLEQDLPRWEIVGREIHSDEPALAMRYVSNADISMPESFANALAWFLAFEIAPYLEQASDNAQSYYALYQTALDEAKAADREQQKPKEPSYWEESKILKKRFSGDRW